MSGRSNAIAAGIALVVATPGCAGPTLTVATEKPIEIRIELKHEVRLVLDQDVQALLAREERQTQVVARTTSRIPDAILVDRAKSQGTLGERADGYLGVTPRAAGDQDALADRVNEERRREYETIAAHSYVPVGEVGKVAGAQRITSAPMGETIRTPEGRWIERDELVQVQVIDRSSP